ncbi:hypothetical protein C8024_13085 [Sphingopyxis sp. BSNA05]|nr:hypothetical protein [Sphingopyxis sp. BSNA05]
MFEQRLKHVKNRRKKTVEHISVYLPQCSCKIIYQRCTGDCLLRFMTRFMQSALKEVLASKNLITFCPVPLRMKMTPKFHIHWPSQALFIHQTR